MAVRDVPMSGTVDVDELPDDRDEVDTETFAKRMMKSESEPKKPLSVDQTHYTAKSDWSTKQRDADIDDALAARGYALAALDENGNPLGEDDDARKSASMKPSKAEKTAEKAETKRARKARARDVASGKKWFSDQFLSLIHI